MLHNAAIATALRTHQLYDAVSQAVDTVEYELQCRVTVVGIGLYGSHAKDIASPESDIDILLVYSISPIDRVVVDKQKTRYSFKLIIAEQEYDITALDIVDYATMYGESNVLFDVYVAGSWLYVHEGVWIDTIYNIGFNYKRLYHQYLPQYNEIIVTTVANATKKLWLYMTLWALPMIQDNKIVYMPRSMRQLATVLDSIELYALVQKLESGEGLDEAKIFFDTAVVPLMPAKQYEYNTYYRNVFVRNILTKLYQ